MSAVTQTIVAQDKENIHLPSVQVWDIPRPNRNNSSRRFEAYVASIVDPVGFVTQYWCKTRGVLLSIDLRAGPVAVRYWCDTNKDLRRKVLSHGEGCTISPILQLNRLFPVDS